MCGICSMIGVAPTKDAKKMFSYILEETEIRGRHATGVATQRGKDFKYFKKPETASKFIKEPLYKDCIADTKKGPKQIMVGHTRYATSGSPAVNKNNHPFISRNGRFAFVHNGVVGMPVHKVGGLKTETDSEEILRQIEYVLRCHPTMPIHIAIKCAMKNFPMADYACILHDTKKQCLYVFRNKERPAFIFDCRDTLGATYVSSSTYIYGSASFKLQMETGSYGLYCSNVINTNPGTIYRIALDGSITRY